MERVTSHLEAGERYTSLRLVGGLFTVLGALLLSGGCLLLAFGLYALRSGWTAPLSALGRPGGGGWWIVWSLALFMSGLQSVAIGALIRLAIHLEENTRVSAQCLEQLRLRTDPNNPMFRS